MLQITEHEMDVFQRFARLHTYKKNELIYQQGDNAPQIYLVRKGRVRMFFTGDNGREITFQIVGEKQLFGESAFLSHASRPTTVVAVVDSEVLSCTISELLPALRESHALAGIIFQLLSDNYSFLCNQVKRLSIYDRYQRIASYLLEQTVTGHSGVGIEEGVLPYTHEELGVCLNLNRVTVTKILNEWEKQGIVALGRKKIKVLDRDALYKILETSPQ
jgi:CRP/FNR family cyclic AMP-dependent transcriptional regulator